MFYWLAAIPFFIALMMLAVVKAPTHDNLKNPENAQTDAAVFRMATQHDMAVRYIEARYAAGNSITNKAAITQANMTPYITNGYIGDYNLVKSYVVCADNDCSKAEKIRVVTVLDPTNGAAYLNTDRLGTFVKQLGNYKASFPMNKKSGEAHNYKGFGKNAYHYAGKVMRTAKSADIFMMEQKEGDNYILPDEVNTLTISNKKVLADGKPAIVTVIGDQPKPQVCSDTQAVDNELWLRHAEKCSACKSNQIQQRRTTCGYPYDSSTTCITIPHENSSEIWSRCENGGCTTVSDKSVEHLVYTHNGIKYHAIGQYINWWEAAEVCKKLGLSLMSREKLIELHSELYSGLFGSSGNPRAWSTQYNNDSCRAHLVRLKEGTSLVNTRNSSPGTGYYAVCGPKN